MTPRGAAHVVGALLLVALVVPFVIYAWPAAVGADAGYVVLSGSMEPAISTGDVIVVDGVEPGAVETGDVITFRRQGERVPTTHRVIEVVGSDDGRAFVTKGDANEERDPQPVPAESVVGRVAITIPLIGYVIQFADTPLGFGLLVAVPFGLLVVTELYDLVRGRDDESGGAAGAGPRGDDSRGDGARSGGLPADGDPVEGAGLGGRDPDAGGGLGGRVEVGENGSAGLNDAASGAAAGPTFDVDADDVVEAFVGDDESEPEGIVLTRSDLRLGGVVTLVFTGYALWVLSQTGITAWSVAAAAAGVLGSLFVGVVYLTLGPAEEVSTDERLFLPTNLATVTPNVATTTHVDRLSTLVGVADRVGHPVLADFSADRYGVVVDTQLYLYEAPTRPPEPTGSAEQGATDVSPPTSTDEPTDADLADSTAGARRENGRADSVERARPNGPLADEERTERPEPDRRREDDDA